MIDLMTYPSRTVAVVGTVYECVSIYVAVDDSVAGVTGRIAGLVANLSALRLYRHEKSEGAYARIVKGGR